jgi:hypothetical protein
VIVETISQGTRVGAYENSENLAKSTIFVTNDVICLLPTNMQSAVNQKKQTRNNMEKLGWSPNDGPISATHLLAEIT